MNKRGNPNLTEQPDSELVYEQDGLIRGQRILIGDAQFIKQVPSRWSEHPDEPMALLFQKKIRKMKLGKIMAVLDYIGIEKDPTDFVVEMTGALNSEPIETHKDFVDVIGGTADAPLNDAVFDDQTGEFLFFPPDAPNDLGGQSTFFYPTVNARRSYWTYNTPNPGPMGKRLGVPSWIILPPTTKDMLYGPICYRQVGRLFQVTFDYLGSGERGCNKLIYKQG